jgi:hypothetical protein
MTVNPNFSKPVHRTKENYGVKHLGPTLPRFVTSILNIFRHSIKISGEKPVEIKRG